MSRAVEHGRVVDGHDLADLCTAGRASSATPKVLRHAPFGAGGEEVANANVRERAADHHAVVAAAAAVAVEIGGLNAMLHQIFAGGAALADITGRGDVIRRHAIA